MVLSSKVEYSGATRNGPLITKDEMDLFPDSIQKQMIKLNEQAEIAEKTTCILLTQPRAFIFEEATPCDSENLSQD